MPAKNEIYSFDGVTFSSLGAGVSGVAQIAESEPVDLEEMYLRRPGSTPLYTPGVIPPATVICMIKYASHAELQALLRLIDYPYSQQLRPLVAYVGDPTSPAIKTMSVAVDSLKIQPGSLDLTFTAPEAVWRGSVGTVQLGPAYPSVYSNYPVGNGGDVSIRGVARFGWVGQRAGGTASLGWKRRLLVNVTAGDEPLVRKTVFFNIGNTSTLVASSEMLSSGDDIRVFFNGEDLPRQLQCMNSPRTHVAWVVDIPAGATAQFEIAWKNANAGSPRTLERYQDGDLETYSALDLGSGRFNEDNNFSTNTNIRVMAAGGLPERRFDGGYMVILSGTGAGQMRKISGFTKFPNSAFTVSRAFTTAPASGSVIGVYASGYVMDGGGASSANSTSITDSSQSFVPNALVGGKVTTISGTGSGQTSTITANTDQVITFSPAMSPAPAAGTSYVVEKNGFQRYYVERLVHTELWRGLWKANKRFGRPSVVRFGAQGVPDGWTPDVYQDNDDDKTQPRVYLDPSVSNHAFPVMRAVRQRNSDKYIAEKNMADGVRIHDPRGFDAIRFDYFYRNEDAVGKFVFAGKESGGEDWTSIVERVTAQAALTLSSMQIIDLSSVGIPTHLIMAAAAQETLTYQGAATSATSTSVTDTTKGFVSSSLIGGTIRIVDGTGAGQEKTIISNGTNSVTWSGAMSPAPTAGSSYEIKKNGFNGGVATAHNEITIESGNILELYLNSTNWTPPTLADAAHDVYDMGMWMRIGGGNSAIPPYEKIETGGVGHRILMKSGEKLYVDGERGEIALYSAGVYMKDVPWAAVIWQYVYDEHGSETRFPSRDFLRMPGGSTTVYVNEDAMGLPEVDYVGATAYLA